MAEEEDVRNVSYLQNYYISLIDIVTMLLIGRFCIDFILRHQQLLHRCPIVPVML